MKNLILTCSLFACLAGWGVPSAEAKNKHKHKHDGDHHDHYEHRESYYGHSSYRDRQRTLYVIERNRPVRRVVYVNPSGRYYRIVDGRRVYIQSRYYTSYPSRYYYPSGRPRISISF